MWEIGLSCSSILRPLAKYDPPSRDRETRESVAGCWLRANHFSFSDHLRWQDLSTRRKKSIEYDVGVQRRRSCGHDKCSSGAQVTSESYLLLSICLRVFPGENHRNLEAVTIGFSTLCAIVGHFYRLPEGSHVGQLCWDNGSTSVPDSVLPFIDPLLITGAELWSATMETPLYLHPKNATMGQ